MISAHVIYVAKISELRILAKLFLLDHENNIPTLFSFGLFVLCSLLLAIISAQESVSGPRRRLHWIFLAGLFFVMAFDEVAQLHERLNFAREPLNASGVFYWAWLIPAWIFMIVFSLAYVRFLLTLPSPFMRLFILSGALFVGGALGIEMAGGAYAEVHGIENVTYRNIASIEEALEMVGLAVFAYTLARFLGHDRDSICLRFS